MLREPEVLNLLGRQHWTATRTQLREMGLTPTGLRRALRNGTLERVAHQVVRLAAAPATFESRAMQLVLAGGTESYLSGPSAARLWGVRGTAEYPIEITIAHARNLTVPPWARLVRTSWLEPELHQRIRDDGLVLASPLRTLMRLAESGGSTPWAHTRFEKAAEDLWHRGLISPTSAAEFLAAVRRSGRGGVLVFENWLQRATLRTRPAQSNAEIAFAAALTAFGLPEPERQYPVEISPGLVVHLDLAYPEVKLAIEPGASWWHGGDERARADDRRDRALAELGWQTLRFDEVEQADLDRCARQVVRVHGRRRHEMAVARSTARSAPPAA
jgi:very-short-patch-repair endonuclease